MRYWVWIGFWALGIIWGSSFLLIGISVKQIPPIQLVFIRTTIAALGLLVVVYFRGQKMPRDWKTLLDLAIIGVGNALIPFALIGWGETTVISSVAGILQSTAALFTLIIAHFAFQDERINARKIAGIVFGFIGVITLASLYWKEGGVLISEFTGFLAIVLASLFYGLFTTYSRKVLNRPGVKIEPIVIAAGTMTAAMIGSGIATYAAPLFGGLPPVALDVLEQDVLLSALMLGFLNTFVAYNIFYFLVREMGASRTSMITYIVPSVSLILGLYIAREPFDIRLIIGAGLIIGAIGIVNLRPFWRSKPEAETVQTAEAAS